MRMIDCLLCSLQAGVELETSIIEQAVKLALKQCATIFPPLPDIMCQSHLFTLALY